MKDIKEKAAATGRDIDNAAAKSVIQAQYLKEKAKSRTEDLTHQAT